MSNMLAIAAELQKLNEMLEAGERLDQLVVVVEGTASEAEIDAAIAANCAEQGVRRENVEQVVIVCKAYVPDEIRIEPVNSR
jgi:hypothetical protein